MNKEQYLRRIKYSGPVDPDNHSLMSLHQSHLYQVPFENLDIHYGRPFDLAFDRVYEKVINKFRGGFCYEVNSLFNRLLQDVGFQTSLISARIYDDNDVEGPELDHMAIHVRTDRDYIADVGFGDSFIKPLEIRRGVQTDGRNYFKIEERNDRDYVLSMSSDGINFKRKYTFNLSDVTIESFHQMCIDKQTNPASYFVKNTLCTKPTAQGRLTIFNDRLMEKNRDGRIDTVIVDDQHLKAQLRDRFGIFID